MRSLPVHDSFFVRSFVLSKSEVADTRIGRVGSMTRLERGGPIHGQGQLSDDTGRDH